MAEIYRDIISGASYRIGDRDSDIFITTHATAPTNGAQGTGVGTLDKGSIIIAKDTGILYENRGTKADPTWNAVGEITETSIGDGQVTESKIANDAVTTDKIADGAVTEAELNASVSGEGLEGGAGDPLKVVISEGTIVEPAEALVVLGSGNAEITFTADVAGVAAHSYSIQIADPGGTLSQELSIEDSDGAIVINPATDGAGVITSSANDVVTAFGTHAGTYSIPITASAGGTGVDPVVAEGPSFLASGVDGTVGYKGQLLFDADFIYVSVDDSTVAVGNWKKAEFTTPIA